MLIHFKLKFVFLALMTFGNMNRALAEEGGKKEARARKIDVCHEEVFHYCEDKKDFAEVGECLLRHDKDLSKECRQELQMYVEARKQASSRGGGALTAFGGLNAFGPPVPLFSYDGRLIPGDKDGGIRQIENKMNLSLPVYRTNTDVFAVSLLAGQVHLGQKLYLDSGAEVPTDLSRVEVGAQYMHQLGDKKNWGLRASIGYAGDNPGHPGSDASYSVSATYGLPGEGSGYWVLMVFMANNSPLANYVPIPGVMYIYKTDTFSGMFGFPILSMQWTPIDPWIFSFSLFGVTAQSEIAYGHNTEFQTFLGYSYVQQSFIPSVRQEDKDRLTLHEQKAGPGVRIPIGMKIQIELQVGASYDRSIYVGNGLLKKDGGSVSMSSDWFGSGSLKYAF